MRKISPSFTYPSERCATIDTCPICRACIHQEHDKEHYPICGKLKNPPKDVESGDKFSCDDFVLNEESLWKEIVLKEM